MPRPFKNRRIRGKPNSDYFKPAGIPLKELEEITLTMDEFEAIRLNDFQQIDQKISAEKMQISQPTFHRILNSGRQKIAEAITKGKAIKITKTIKMTNQ